jgi:hypothetical protein
MSTTVKIENVYCVYDPDGIPILRTVENEPDDSIGRLTPSEDIWRYWYLRDGYTCRPVRVTIEEIEKPKTKNDE